MEYAYALFRNSATDGCRYNAILNSGITLNSGSSNPTYGIYLAPTSISGIQVNATTAAGTNSYNSLRGDFITTARTGLYAAEAGLNDNGKVPGDITGTSPGNTIANSSSFRLLVFNARNTTIGSNDIRFGSSK